MATHKVIQDIEAEDKFLGPLTLKQFIFAGAGVFFIYLSFFAVTKGAGFLLVLFLPIALLGIFLAIPWSSDQSTELWVLAKLRFRFKSQIRVWDQAGLEELVTITVPKKIEKQLTNGLDQIEVRSRLKALAETIDSRGWAIKHASLSENYSPLPPEGERLIDLRSIPSQVPDTNLAAYEDAFDEQGTIANTFNHMMEESSEIHKQESLYVMDQARRGEPTQQQSIGAAPTNFMPPASPYAAPQQAPAVAPQAAPAQQQQQRPRQPAAKPRQAKAYDEKSLSDELRHRRDERDQVSKHLKRFPVNPDERAIQPSAADLDPTLQTTPVGNDATMASATDDGTAAGQAQASMTNTPDPGILNLAQNNDLNIDTIARQANKNVARSGDDEVVISLR